jgi:hypothetical protein
MNMNVSDEESMEDVSPEVFSVLAYPEEDLRHIPLPLDQTVAEDLEIVRTTEVEHLLERWRGGLHVFPAYLHDAEARWQQTLNAEQVINYSSAVSALMENVLLNGFQRIEDARGTVLQPASEPCFQVYPDPESTLAEESGGGPGRSVIFRVQQFSSQISLRCGVPIEYGELAWRALAHCMQEHQLDGILPGVHIERMHMELSVRLRERYPVRRP